jgi:hypothetical protein
MNRSMILATLAATLLAVPVGIATWSSYGQSEPNTSFDTSGLMYAEAPLPGQVRVYFNAYTTTGSGSTKGVSPNVGALGTRMEAGAIEHSYAVLGVWTDCNGDGYIGLAEGAAIEYSNLVPNSCTARTGGATCFQAVPPGQKCPNWPTTGYNNYNGIVTELIPIVGGGARPGGDARVIRDPQAAVWGDFGRPTDGAEAGGTCAITPFPRGTAQSSGGLITYADCRSGFMQTWNTAVDAAGDPAGLRFANDSNGRSGELGQFETLGDRYDDPDRNSDPIVKAQDCDSAVLVPFEGTPLAQQTDSEGIRSPSTDVDPDGTIAGTINYTFESGPFPTRQVSAETGPESTSNCDASDDRGDDAYGVILNEGDFNSVSADNKHESDWNYVPAIMSRGGVPLGVGHLGAAGDPADMGLTPVDIVAGGLAYDRTEWDGATNFAKGTPGTVVNRGGLSPDDLPDPALAEGYWITTYARVGAITTGQGVALPGGAATQKYGSTQCGSFTSGIHNGWNCDVSTWNKNPDGSSLPSAGNILAFPTLTYQLRDSDCYDGSLGVGVGAQPAFYGERNCDTN